ncbi:MAG: hypothetical protein IT364_27305 [Candidatus Hydrogenedentes bacterium]|nr:hypothetical protein [Candidatus Hydrogenedentota bacterium]
MQRYLGIVACLCPAAVLTYCAADSPVPVLLIVASFFWLLSGLTLRNLLLSPLSLSVDADGLSCKRLYNEVRIPFDDAVELKVSERRGKTVMRLRSRTRSIVCDNNYENWTDLLRLVKNHVPEDILDNPISREFRYPGSFRFLFAASVLLFAGAVVGASVSGLLDDHSHDFKSEVLFPVLGFGAFTLGSLYAFLEVSEKVYFGRDRIVSDSWRGRREVVFGDQMTVERVRPWHGDERLVVSSGKERISISHQLVGYEDLIHDLNEIVSVKWRREEAVSFPLEVRLNLWWIPPAFYCSFGGALAVYFIYQGVEMLRSGEGGSGVQSLIGGSFGAFMLWLGLRHLLTCPKSAAFDEYGFTVRLAFATRHYSPEQVESIVYREERRKGNVFGRIVIRVDGREYVLADPGVNVPLVPVYKLTCNAYWPEGYREPEPLITNRGETGE